MEPQTFSDVIAKTFTALAVGPQVIFVVAVNLIMLSLLRLPQCPNWIAIVLPLVLSMTYGALKSLGGAVDEIFANVVIYGGSNVLIGYGVHMLWQKYTANQVEKVEAQEAKQYAKAEKDIQKEIDAGTR